MYGGQIPFVTKAGAEKLWGRPVAGSMLTYGYGSALKNGYVELVDNHEFVATLFIVDYRRGRSAFNLILENTAGSRYYVMASDIMKVIKAAEKGSVTGRWVFCKKGSNYGIQLLEEL